MEKRMKENEKRIKDNQESQRKSDAFRKKNDAFRKRVCGLIVTTQMESKTIKDEIRNLIANFIFDVKKLSSKITWLGSFSITPTTIWCI